MSRALPIRAWSRTRRCVLIASVGACLGAALQHPAVAADGAPDVWMNVQFGSVAGKLKAQFYVVWPDGAYLPRLPEQGLAGFDRAAHRKGPEADSWGRFAMNGDTGQFESRFERIAVQRVSPTRLKKVGYSFDFYRAVPVDGLRLAGTWSPIPNWSKDPYYGQAGCRQVLHLKPDGSFDDRGVWVADCGAPRRHPDRAPGSGRYEVRDFTIVFAYADGRRVARSLTGVNDRDPARSNEVLYFGGNPFFAR